MKTLIAILAILSLAGCAVNKATINTFVDPNFGTGDVSTVALFPIRNARLAPSEAQQINRKISMAINKRRSDIKIVGSQEAINILNEQGLADDWAKFLENYVLSGVPDATVLQQVGNALQVDAIMQGEMVNIFQQDGAYGQNGGTTRVTVRFTMLNYKNGKLLWEASNDGIRGTATTLESAPPIIEAVNLAVDKILATIPF